MTKRFAVLGYPNSRLPWFSQFLTISNAICQAEVNRLMWDFDNLNQFFEGENYSHMGVADSALGVFASQIYEEVCTTILVVERDPEDIERIQHAAGLPPNNYIRLMAEEFEKIRGRPGVMFLPFEKTRERADMQKAFWHCLPGVGFDELRWDSISELYIDMDPIIASIRLKDEEKRLKRLFRDVLPRVLVKDMNENRTH